MNWNIYRWQSLNTRVTLFTLSIFVVSIWSLFFYASQMLREDITRQLSEQQMSTASIVATSINNELTIRLRALDEVGKLLAPSIADTAALQTLLEQQSVLELLFNGGVVVIGRDGIALGDLPRSTGRIGVTYKGDEWIEEALGTGKSTIGRPTIGKKLGVPVFVMTVPIREPQGEVIGVMAGVVNLGKPNFLDKIAEGRYGKTGGYLLVAPKYRLIVTASDKSRIMESLPGLGINPEVDHHVQGYESAATFVNARGVEVLSTSKNIPVAGWYLVASLPSEEAFAPISAMQQRMLLATLLTTLLAGVLTWWMVRRQLAPMLAAVKTLAAVADGKQKLLPLSIARQDEVGELISGLNHLLQELAQREEALKTSEARFRSLFNNAEVAMFRSRLDGSETLDCNHKFLELVGRSRKEVIGSPSVVLWKDPRVREEMARQLKAEGHVTDFEFEMLNPHGEVRQCLTSLRLSKEEGLLEGSIGDITERKLAEEAIARESRRSQAFLRNASDGVHVLDADGNVLEVSDSFCEMLGYSREALIGANVSLWDVQWSPQELKERIAEQMAKGDRSIFTTKQRRRDGSFFDVELTGQGLELDGKPVLFNSARDISERVRSAQQLVEAEAQFRGLVEQAIAGIFIIQDGKFVYANPRAAEIVAQGPSTELIDTQPLRWIVEADRAKVAENMRSLLAGETQSVVMDFGVPRRDGVMIQVGANAARATHKGRPAIIGLLQDISETTRAEEQIKRYVKQLETAFMSTVEVATSLSEMRDPYTGGHERRVGKIAAAIGTELGLDDQRIEGLRVAGYLHDIGKITIPSEILSKPGKLSAIEFELIQGHAKASYDVLKDVEFPWPVAQVALQHHERMDGSGYPQGLKGEAILLEARIMAVADVIEAMSSHRPYRAGLGIEAALAEIERGGANVYDPVVAGACLKLFREKGYAIPA